MNDSWLIDTYLAAALALLLVGIYLIRRRTPGMNELFDSAATSTLVFGKLLPLKTARQAGYGTSTVLLPLILLKLAGLFTLPYVWSLMAPGQMSWSSMFAVGLTGLMGPDVVLWFLARRRKARISAILSQFADFLVVMMRSGLTLTDALARVSEHGLPGKHPLTTELRATLAQMCAGQDWNTAFGELADNTGVRDLKRISTTLEIGHRTGVPVVETLSGKADILREQYVQRIEKQLNRKTVEALLPILLLGFPMFGVLVFFPTGVQIYEAYTLFTSSW